MKKNSGKVCSLEAYQEEKLRIEVMKNEARMDLAALTKAGLLQGEVAAAAENLKKNIDIS